jgi:hypothetical protein
MPITFKPKAIPLSYKVWTEYKLFQLVAILKLYGSCKLNEVYLLIYILDSGILLEDLIKQEKNLFPIYLSNKIVEFALSNKIIEFSRLRLYLSEKGKELYDEAIKEKLFNDLIQEVKLLKNKKKEIKTYLKSRVD